jgi:saccharopine dehydrogenase-like NADP-dependent oxidoreductase
MKHVVVLGAGRVGSAIIRDLAPSFAVTAVDSDADRLARLKHCAGVTPLRSDLQDRPSIDSAVGRADAVVNALPGRMGFAALRTLVECRKDVVDISFFEEDPFDLDALAKKNGVTAAVDCGVAPGMSNMILGFHDSRIKLDFFECLVGGLPFERSWPYQYKAPFSPSDVLEEYTRPARLVENGRVVTRPALNTDGLRTLLKTMRIPEMKEKTLRYPGHAEIMRILRETGFFGKDPVDVDGKSVRPVDLASRLLFPLWQLGETENEFTVMRIDMRGHSEGRSKRVVYDLFDRFDPSTGTASMARTTGYACTAVVRLLMDGRIKEKGVLPPEKIGAMDGCFEFVLEYMKERGVVYTVKEENLE